jgi:ubiquinone/menaquinone biosynthesis C-methylase UbiE
MRTELNVDARTVEGFGDEWSRFDQSEATDEELQSAFEKYFAVFPWDRLPHGAAGVDVGCGSGRWARRVAPRVGSVTCVDASERALAVAKRNLRDLTNVSFVHGSVGELPFGEDTFDFGYSLGVLHHVPDTGAGIRECTRVLKRGAPLLLYLYYALENRPGWYRGMWKASDVVRRAVCRMPVPVRHKVADLVAAGVYWPLARAALTGERLGLNVASMPLAFYRKHSFYIMRNDALDRFGTSLEQRFTREQIKAMMTNAGLVDVNFHDGTPFWCAVGFKG